MNFQASNWSFPTANFFEFMGDANPGSKPSSGAGRSPAAAQGGGMTVAECQDFILKSFKGNFLYIFLIFLLLFVSSKV